MVTRNRASDSGSFGLDGYMVKFDGFGPSSNALQSGLPSKQDLIDFHKTKNLINYHRHQSVDRAK